MSLRFYMDEVVPIQITTGLRARGLDVLTVQEDGFTRTADLRILAQAEALGRVTFTNDDDFLIEATRRQQSGQSFAGIVYAHQRVSIGRCIADLAFIGLASEPHEFLNRVQYLPL